MIKDLIVNLTVAGGRDVAGPFALSIAETFNAHVVGVAFAYEPVIPPTIMGTIPASLIEGQRTENENAAADATARFDEAARRAGVSSQSVRMSASVPGAAERFGAMARRFDLAVAGQSEADTLIANEVIVEGALFGAGRPVVVVPYIQKAP